MCESRVASCNLLLATTAQLHCGVLAQTLIQRVLGLLHIGIVRGAFIKAEIVLRFPLPEKLYDPLRPQHKHQKQEVVRRRTTYCIAYIILRQKGNSPSIYSIRRLGLLRSALVRPSPSAFSGSVRPSSQLVTWRRRRRSGALNFVDELD